MKLNKFKSFIFLGSLSTQLSLGDHGYCCRHLCIINAFQSPQVDISLPTHSSLQNTYPFNPVLVPPLIPLQMFSRQFLLQY